MIKKRKHEIATVPDAFEDKISSLSELVAPVEGQLSAVEIRCLALLASSPTAKGCILEIGSFKGRSTIVLAVASSWTLANKVVAVDPFSSPAETDPDLKGLPSAKADFENNLTSAGVIGAVEVHEMLSTQLAEVWPPNKMIRLLWIDGDHTFKGTHSDFDRFKRFLSPGAIVAFHDVLHAYPGPASVFCEEVLASESFGAWGLCGSIGWAQYCPDKSKQQGVKSKKTVIKLLRLMKPLIENRGRMTVAKKLFYKMLRALVPHGPMDIHYWVESVVNLSLVDDEEITGDQK